MIAFEEYKKEHYRIEETKSFSTVYLDGDVEEVFSSFLEAEDYVEEHAEADLAEYNHYKCDFCNVYFKANEPEHRIEDSSFTAPYGSTFVLGEDISSVAVCPTCGRDLEIT